MKLKLLQILFVISAYSVLSVVAQVQSFQTPFEIVDFVMDQKMLDAGIGGKVILDVKIGKDGKPTYVAATHGPIYPCGTYPVDLLASARNGVVRSVENSRFETTANGKSLVGRSFAVMIDLDGNYRKANRHADSRPAKPVMISGGVLNGKAVSLPAPTYPIEAKASNASGPFTVQILVDGSGKVLKAGSFSGNGLLANASRDAACSSRFTMTKLQGEPIMVSGTLVYNFVL